jgi:glycerophosphoryl diester phosphodiesterase
MILGAELKDSDVQLTKDHVPVIYHDFLVSETGTDSPMHTLTLDQVSHHDSLNFSSQLLTQLYSLCISAILSLKRRRVISHP